MAAILLSSCGTGTVEDTVEDTAAVDDNDMETSEATDETETMDEELLAQKENNINEILRLLTDQTQQPENDMQETTNNVVHCTISVVVDDETKFGPVDAVVSGTTENPPTVLQAVAETLADNGVNCETDNNRLSNITLDGEDYRAYSNDTFAGGWYYLCNGIEPETGTMHSNKVHEGDVIEVQYGIFPVYP